MEFRTRPKSDYLLEAEWQELHALTLHWQSDMAFFGDELRFIDLLIDKYFTSLVDNEHIAITKDVAARISDIKKIYVSLHQKVSLHLRHIETYMASPLASDAFAFRNEHGTLEDELVSFVKSFRDLKRSVFQLTEQVAKNEKEKHLLGK